VFWKWPEAPDLGAEGWARVRMVEVAAGRELPIHPAPADVLVVCVAGTIRFLADGEERDLGPGDGVALRAGAPHAIRAGDGGRVLLILRQEEP